MNCLVGIIVFGTLTAYIESQPLYENSIYRQRTEEIMLKLMMTELRRHNDEIERMLVQKLSGFQSNIEAIINGGETQNRLKTIEGIGKFLLTSGLRGRDCADILDKNPWAKGRDGVYSIQDAYNTTRNIYCDMSTAPGGWTVIQRRVDGSVSFERNWADYKIGFGSAYSEYWIGNDWIHQLTSAKSQEIRIDMETFEKERKYALYSNFSVGNEGSKYLLKVAGYSGNAGDALKNHNNHMFSTPDQDNDDNSGKCATAFGWWFRSCFEANPNGVFSNTEKYEEYKYIYWDYWKNKKSLKSVQLMIRPRF